MENSKKPDKKNPRNGANIISQLFFLWFIPILWKGAKSGLNANDLTMCLEKDLSQDLGDKLEREWKKQIDLLTKDKQKSILRIALLNTFLSAVILDGFLIFIFTMLRTLTPLVLGQLLRQYQQPIQQLNSIKILNLIEEISKSNNNNNNSSSKIYILNESSKNVCDLLEYIWNDKFCLSIMLILMLCVGAFLFHHTDLRQRMIGARMRIACSSLIYRKTLRLSKQSVGKASAGHLINLLSNDVNRFDLGFILAHYIWILPIQASLTCFLLWREIGVAAIVGVGFLLLQTVPVQPQLSRLSSMLRGKIAIRSGKRIGIMNEIIQGIQVIKMYAWEKSFNILIDKVRQREMKQIRIAFYIGGINSTTKIFIGRLTLFITILTIVILGQNFTPYIIFSMAQYYQYLQLTTAIFYTLALTFGAQALIAIDRIEEYLLFEEKNDKLKGYTQIHIKSYAMISSLNLNSIEIINASANWNNNSTIDDQLALNNILVNVKAGQLCAIIGPVGSGKTSLLQLLLGELPIICGNCIIKGDISYASQEPWLFSDTIRNNILFGEEYNEERYNEVLEYCALKIDLMNIQDGDQSIVGERGMMLSGGQRARINLARAIYKSSEIYLLDDPLSAVDVNVGKFLFEKIVGPKGFLACKEKSTRLLVTHQIQFLKEADIIIVMDNGKIIQQGSYSELVNRNLNFATTLSNLYQTESNNGFDEKLREINEINDSDNNDESSDNEEIPFVDNVTEYPLLLNSNRSKSIISSKLSIHKTISTAVSTTADDNKEKKMEGNISITVWKQYFAASGSILILFMVLLLIIVSQILISGTDYFVNYWTQQEFLRQNNESIILAFSTYEYLYIYGGLMCCLLIFCFMRCFIFITILMKASSNLHNKMFINLLNAPMKFFDKNPLGRIINRFSKDIGTLDEWVPRTMFETLQTLALVIGVVILISIVNPLMIITLIITVIFYIMILKLHLRSSQDLKRLEGITKSPVFSYVTTTLTGLSTIRARNLQTKLINEFDHLQNVHSGVWHFTITTANCLGIWLDFISTLFTSFVTLSFLGLENVYSGNVGLAVTQSLSLTGNLQFGFKQIAETIHNMISTERILEYTNIEQEQSPNKKAPNNWPENGKIQFNNMSLKYDEKNSTILKNIQLDIESKWKIGIVGRTGAGKSSLINALFRLSIIEGEIIIDGLDTSSISLESLRSKISIIPQDPFLFAATVRYNLDPIGLYDDHQLWNVLENVKLKKSISSLDDMITEGGNNFSVGQRQLLCLARAMLCNNKILVLDEATANVDPQTDELIQQTIRNKFNNCTLLMIAHRLHTVIDADRIIVMDKGEVKEFDIPYRLLVDKTSVLSEMVNATESEEAEKLKNIAYQKYIKIN